MTKYLVPLVLLCATLNAATTYYIAPSGGSDANSGTSYSAPLASFPVAIGKLSPGDTLILKNGTYSPTPSASVTATINSGSTTVNASGAIFTDAHKGQTLRFTNNVPPWGATINTVNSTTQVSLDDTPPSTITSKPFLLMPRIVINGLSGNPSARIYFKAETDRQVTIDGGGGTNSVLPVKGVYYESGKDLFRMDYASYWWIQGVRFVNSEGSCVLLDGYSSPAENTAYNIITNCVASAPNPRQNAHGMAFQYAGAYSNLVVDSTVTRIHRHPVMFFVNRGNKARRVWTDHLDYRYSNQGIDRYTDVYTNWTAWSCVSLYDTTDALVENCFGNGGIDMNGDYGFGPNNRVIACGLRDTLDNGGGSPSIGGMMRGRDAAIGTYPTDCLWQDLVSVRSQSHGFDNIFAAGTVITNSVFAESGVNGLRSGVMHEFWDTFDPNLQTKASSIDIYKTVFYDNYRAYSIEAEPGYGSTHTVRLFDCLAQGNSVTANVDTDSQIVFSSSGMVNTSPGYDTTTFGDGAYLRRAPNFPTKGAEAIYQTVDGTLTSTPLWPWPNEAAVLAETGKSATWSTNGGWWKTLDGVYPSEPGTGVFYVRKDGSDSNDGTTDNAAGAWLTIGKAATAVNPGDTVYVRQGVYEEQVQLTRPGTESDPIRWIGEGGYGNWLTIVDPSVSFSSGWVTAPEVGAGVYKHTSPPFYVRHITADGYTVAMMNAGWAQTNNYGLTYLGYPDGYFHTNMPPYWEGAVYPGVKGMHFWDGKEALAMHSTNGNLYLRFRDGSAPSSHSVRIQDVGTYSDDKTISRAGIQFTPTADYNEVYYFNVRGALVGIGAVPATESEWNDPNSAIGQIDGLIIASNFVENAKNGISLSRKIASSPFVNARINNPKVIGNLVRTKMFAEQYGAFGGEWYIYNFATRTNYAVYNLQKSPWGSISNAEGQGIALAGTDGGQIVFNTVSNGGGGIMASHYANHLNARPSADIVASNNLYNLSGAGMILGYGLDDARVFRNSFLGCYIFLRAQSYNLDRSYQTRVFCYENTGSNPTFGTGDAIYIHAADPGTFAPEWWFYHNSFERVTYGLHATPKTTNTMINTRAINNIFTVTAALRTAVDTNGFPRHLGAFVKNRTYYPPTVYGSWVSDNISDASYEFGNPPPPYLLSSNSLSISQGIPVEDTFTLLSQSYNALPGYTNGGPYYSGTLPDLGANQYDFEAPTNPPPGEITNVLYLVANPPSNVLKDDHPENTSPALFSVHRADVVVGGNVVPNTFSNVTYYISVSSPDGAVEDTDYTVGSTSGTILDGYSWTNNVTVDTLRNPTYTGQRTVTVSLVPDDAYEIGGGSPSINLILLDADLPPAVTTTPRPNPGYSDEPTPIP